MTPAATWRLGTVYFAIFGAVGCVAPFLPLILLRDGLDAREVGWVMGVFPMSQLIHPLWSGPLADRYGNRALVLSVALGGAALTAPLLFIGHDFVGALAAVAVYSLFLSNAAPLADAVTHQALGARAHRYSMFRVWGSLGFALVAWMGGWLGAIAHASWLGWCSFGLLAAAAVVVHSFQSPVMESGRRLGYVSEMKALGGPATVLLLVATAVYSTAHGVFDNFIGLRVDELGFRAEFVGTLWAIAVCTEVAVMFVAPHLLRRWLPSGWLMAAGLCATLRWLWIAHAVTKLELAIAQPVHGVTFGLWYLASTAFVQLRVDAERRATVQGAFAAAMGLGRLIGAVGGGQLIDASGSQDTFTVASAIALCAMLLFTALYVRYRGSESRPGVALTS